MLEKSMKRRDGNKVFSVPVLTNDVPRSSSPSHCHHLWKGDLHGRRRRILSSDSNHLEELGMDREGRVEKNIAGLQSMRA